MIVVVADDVTIAVAEMTDEVFYIVVPIIAFCKIITF